ncbi:MAG: Ig-like domain-containing protein [Burkholderiaceae bacterium]
MKALTMELIGRDGLVTRLEANANAVAAHAREGDLIRIVTANGLVVASATAAAGPDGTIAVSGDGNHALTASHWLAELLERHRDDADEAPLQQTVDSFGNSIEVSADSALNASATGAPILLAQQSTPAASAAAAGTDDAAGGLVITADGSQYMLSGIAAAGIGLAFAAGRGGGDTPAVDLLGPAAPVIDTVAGNGVVNAAEKAAGVAVTGTTEANATVAVTWGSTTHTVTADGAGRFTASFASGEIPADGNSTISATATDTSGNLGTAASASVSIDTAAPATPTIATVATDNTVNSAEKAAGVTVGGTAEAGSTVAVTWGTTTHSATADGAGNYSVSFAAAELPAGGTTSIAATATDAAGNASAAASASVLVDTSAPAAPTIAAVATDDIVNSAEATAGVAVTGAAEANSTVAVTWGGTTHSASADGAGNWSVSFASGEVPADATASTISATATDAAGNAGSAATHTVAIDKTAPQAPTASIGIDGSVVGVAEPGATLRLDHDGNAGTAPLTATAGSNGNYAFGAGTVAPVSGQSLNIDSLDAAGNPSTTTVAVAPTAGTPGADTMTGTAGVDKFLGLASDDVMTGAAGNDVLDGGTGNDNMDGGDNNDILIGGAGNDTMQGGALEDLLIGDAGGGVRNYQFEYWDANLSALNSSANGAAFNFTTDIGWNISNNLVTRNFSGTDQTSGTVFELLSNNVNADPAWPDPTGSGQQYYWDASYASFQQGGAVSQNIFTAQGELHLVDAGVGPDYDTSLVVSWNGAVLATYDGIADTWSGTAPTVTDTAPSSNRQLLSWTVQGSQTGDASQLQVQAFDNDGLGMRIDRITLDAVTAGGDDTIAGGAGYDRIYGQGGNDTLYGGDLGATPGTTEGVADMFFYSMRSDNGNDVIKDFQVGVDAIYLVDVLDTHVGTGTFDAVTNPDASRYPGSQSDTATAANVDESDFNINYLDLTQASSANQYLTLSDDGGGNLKISFFGAGTGAALGSVVLEGVAYEGAQVNNNGAYGSIAEMLGAHDSLNGDGYIDPNIDTAAGGFAGSTVSETQALVFVTMDGFHQSLI